MTSEKLQMQYTNKSGELTMEFSESPESINKELLK
jgi:hypothetical protein